MKFRPQIDRDFCTTSVGRPILVFGEEAIACHGAVVQNKIGAINRVADVKKRLELLMRNRFGVKCGSRVSNVPVVYRFHLTKILFRNRLKLNVHRESRPTKPK